MVVMAASAVAEAAPPAKPAQQLDAGFALLTSPQATPATADAIDPDEPTLEPSANDDALLLLLTDRYSVGEPISLEERSDEEPEDETDEPLALALGGL